MSKTGTKTYHHSFYPLTMLKNYITQTKISVEQFFKQYLKPQGKYVLITFNRFMILAMLLNIDIKLAFLIGLIVYLIVKLIKIRQAEKNTHNNLPLSYINKKNGIRKKEFQLYNQVDLKVQKNHIFSKQQQVRGRSKTLQQKLLRSIKNESKQNQNQKLIKSHGLFQHFNNSTKSKDLPKHTITNYQSTDLQSHIYLWINKLLSGYQTLIWYAKWKFLLSLNILAFIVYLFQPMLHDDTLHIIATQKDGQLLVDQIRRASEYNNQFHLVAIWIVVNIGLFCYFGTNQLKGELLEEIYIRDYRTQIVKKTRLKAKRNLTGADDVSIRLTSIGSQIETQLPSPKKYKSIAIRKQKLNDKPVDINKLKQFSIKSDGKTSPTIQNSIFNSKNTFLKSDPQQCKTVLKPLKIQMVDSEEDYESQNEEQKNKFNKQKNKQKGKQKISNFKQIDNERFKDKEPQQSQQILTESKNHTSKATKANETSSQIFKKLQEFSPGKQSNIESKLSTVNQNFDGGRYKLKRKGQFFPSINNENLIKKQRKASQDFKNQQVYKDFKLNLFKVQNNQNENK